MSDTGRKAVAGRPIEPSKGEASTDKPRHGRVEITIGGIPIEVPPELEAAVHRAYKGLCQSLPVEMTTTQAAEFLDVSRPFVIKLVQRRELPCRMVGKHRRIPTEALRSYREKMFQKAKMAADEMAALSQDLGLYDTEGPPQKKAP
jgi:excisionase family DNA binding protein